MRIAVISDIHGNAVALEAVLKDLRRQGQVDSIIFAGDFFAPGPAIETILPMLLQFPVAHFLAGNADRYLAEGSYLSVYGTEGWQGALRAAFQWTAERLGPAERLFLRLLPFSQTIRVGDWRLLAVHGSPRSDEEGLTPKTGAAEFDQMGVDPTIALLTCGHTHLPMDRFIRGVRVVNAGSVGIPFDGDYRPCYALINLEEENPRAETAQVELRRVDYDVEKAVKQFYTVNHPATDIGVYNLRHGRPMQPGYTYSLKSSLHQPQLVVS